MNFTFSKIDPSRYNILPIRRDECPEQSLSTIGINFSALDAELCNIGFSAENYWNPMYTQFSTNSSSWNSVFNTIASNSACWQSTYLTVSQLSAAWLSPITILYPSVFEESSFNRTTIENWVKDNFPVTQGGCVNYLNGQIMKIFTLEYAVKEQAVTCRCNATQGKLNVRWIGIGAIPINCGCSCKAGSVMCPDKFVKKVLGIEMIVDDGEWIYLRDVY